MNGRAPRVAWVCAALAAVSMALAVLSPTGGATASEPLMTLEHRVVTVQLVPEDQLAVPKGLKGSILVELVTGDGSEADVGDFGLGGRPCGGDPAGPSFPAQTVYGLGEALMLPPMALGGSYSLDAIRLVDTATGETRLEANPGSVAIEVFDEVLVTTVTSHPLSLEEIQKLGIVIDEENARVVEFEVGLVIDGETFEVEFPVVSPTFSRPRKPSPRRRSTSSWSRPRT